MHLLDLAICEELDDALVREHQILVEQMSELTRLLHLKQDLASDVVEEWLLP